MSSTESDELDRLCMSVANQPGAEPLWPNPNWTQEAAMIAFAIHQLREQVNKGYEQVATVQMPDPNDERAGLWLDIEDRRRISRLPPGTPLFIRSG